MLYSRKLSEGRNRFVFCLVHVDLPHDWYCQISIPVGHVTEKEAELKSYSYFHI